MSDCPTYVNTLITRNSDIRCRNSRHGGLNLVCSRFNRGTDGWRCFSSTTARQWNSLPNDIKTETSLVNLRKALNNYFLSRYKDIGRFKVKA